MLSFLKRKNVPIEVRVINAAPAVFFDAYAKRTRVMRMQCVRREADILIGDIVPFPDGSQKNLNKGYGSKLMEELLKYAKDNSIRKVTGNLSMVDADHKDRLYHFYEKFGFVITEFDSIKDSCYYGEIYKEIEV